MHLPRVTFLIGALGAVAVEAVPQSSYATKRVRQSTSSQLTQATLPQYDAQPDKRAAAIAERASGFLYGPPVIGQAGPFPQGVLGDERTQADMDLWQLDRKRIDAASALDLQAVQAAITANGGLKSLDDYAQVLYQNQWKATNPRGTAPGIMTNFTQDLLFSMERLTQNPYSLKLVRPDQVLPFEMDEALVEKITSTKLEDLQAGGQLFYVDYSRQLVYPKTNMDPKRYGAACTAYFYIDPKDGDFLPLAIKTNVGKDLIYTPLDTKEDWLLAKMMFNVNDMFHSQMLHLVITHDVSEAVHQAALHTLSEHHPVMIILERLMIEGYSAQITGETLCFNEGGHWDQLMYINNTGCRDFVSETWPIAGRFQDGYLDTDLKIRGILNNDGEHPFKSFPFYEDAKRIRNTQKAFFSAFVDSYYATDKDVAADYEIQNWFIEATANAGVHDFPTGVVTKATLVDVLTHFSFIVSVVHHSLNGGDPQGSKATLPFHLPALFAPVPEAKGVTDLMPFLPAPAQSLHYIGFIASFNRGFYQSDNRTLDYAFSEDTMLDRLNLATKDAVATFVSSMRDLSNEIRARSFDSDGLSMGAPFVYRTIDPGFIPWISAV